MPKDRIDPDDEGGEAPCWAHLDVDDDDAAIERDATAVGTLARGLPRRVVTVLRAESLVNDGTALVIYGLAVGVTAGEDHLATLHVTWLLVLSYGGGVLAGAAVSLRFIAGGIDEVRTHSRFRPWSILGAGLLVAGATAAAPLLAGDHVLESTYWTRNLGVLGTVKVTTALAFDIGVYLVVVGLVLMVFEAFGDDPEVEPA